MMWEALLLSDCCLQIIILGVISGQLTCISETGDRYVILCQEWRWPKWLMKCYMWMMSFLLFLQNNSRNGNKGRNSNWTQSINSTVRGWQLWQPEARLRYKALTADQIDALDEDEVEKLYAHYGARLRAAMTKTLGQAALQIYSWQ